jgi:hypothetical protein
MELFQQILFVVVAGAAAVLFLKRIFRIRANILLGRDEDRSDQPGKRWRNVLLIAFGQKKNVQEANSCIIASDDLCRFSGGEY